MEFWDNILGNPTKIVAPMVDASELAWRLLSRKYGAELCYTPMLHSAMFVKDSKYRKEALATCEEDQPLIIQFCGNDPQIMLEAALLAEDYCCAIDINLGCPQAIAKRGHYGSYLQDEWELVSNIVSTLSKACKVPITCKIRRFECVDKTIKYAKLLEDSGCKVLTLHGRTREMKGPLTGLADWSYVKEVKKALNIPVISNGNIQTMQDITNCLMETHCDAVMTAEGNLYNPYLFANAWPPCWEPALEYLELVVKYPCPLSYIRGHLFKLFHHLLNLPENAQLRINLGAANSVEGFFNISKEIRDKYIDFHNGVQSWSETTAPNSCNLVLPPWLCQSYIRLPPDEHIKLVEEKEKAAESGGKRKYLDGDGNAISRKMMKKLRRVQRRPDKQAPSVCKLDLVKCASCFNPQGGKCLFKLCKKCCKDKCFLENLDCAGHRILVKSRREMAQFYKTGQGHSDNKNR